APCGGIGEGRHSRGPADPPFWPPAVLGRVLLPPEGGRAGDPKGAEAPQERRAGEGGEGLGLGLREDGSQGRSIPAHPGRQDLRLSEQETVTRQARLAAIKAQPLELFFFPLSGMNALISFSNTSRSPLSRKSAIEM